MAVCSEIHTKHINTLCGQNVEIVSSKLGGTYSEHWALKGYILIAIIIFDIVWFVSSTLYLWYKTTPTKTSIFSVLRRIFTKLRF